MIIEQEPHQPIPWISFVSVGLMATTFSICLLVSIAVIARFFPFNRTTSMPFGIYRVVSNPVTRGAIVGGCVPDAFTVLGRERGYLHSGICRSGTRPVLKYVAAVPGDSVEIRWSGVFVNGTQIRDTAVLRADSLGRALPNQIGTHFVRPGEYWLISNYEPGSFDSRYFGPVTEIVDVVEPILITESTRTGGASPNSLRLGGNKG